MCLLTFSITFNLNFRCNYGNTIYVVGNTEALGNWDANKGLKLNWSEGHFWSKKVMFVHDNTKLIEYKYVIGPTHPEGQNMDRRWEEGPNRVLNLLSATRLFINLKDEWEHRKVRVALHEDSLKNIIGPNASLLVVTNLSYREEPKPMKLKRLYYSSFQEANFWVASFQVPYRASSFQYRFKVEDNQDVNKSLLAKAYHSFSLKKLTSPTKEDASYKIDCGTLVKFDFDFHSPMAFSMITEHIYVGEFPKTQVDIDMLASKKITAVLNLQTEEDMKRYSVDWESLKKYYEKVNIKVENLPIIDMDNANLTLKIQDAGLLINKLLQENEKIYVHCTAGRYRSPHAVIFYLWSYQNYELNKAISLVKSKRKKTKIFETIFEQRLRAAN